MSCDCTESTAIFFSNSGCNMGGCSAPAAAAAFADIKAAVDVALFNALTLPEPGRRPLKEDAAAEAGSEELSPAVVAALGACRGPEESGSSSAAMTAEETALAARVVAVRGVLERDPRRAAAGPAATAATKTISSRLVLPALVGPGLGLSHRAR